VVTNLLHSYDAAGGNLIVVVGATDRENGWIGEGAILDCASVNIYTGEALTATSIGGACCG
jgi:DNA excision repair protein ERCC-4